VVLNSQENVLRLRNETCRIQMTCLCRLWRLRKTCLSLDCWRAILSNLVTKVIRLMLKKSQTFSIPLSLMELQITRCKCLIVTTSMNHPRTMIRQMRTSQDQHWGSGDALCSRYVIMSAARVPWKFGNIWRSNYTVGYVGQRSAECRWWRNLNCEYEFGRTINF